MKITGIQIRNYRSLKAVKLDGLGSLVVLVGRNGSGKSNLLEALEVFFSDLNLQGDVAKQFDPSAWFDRRTSPPIDFELTLELSDRDMERVFDADVTKQMAANERPKGPATLRVHRQVVTNVWHNVESVLEGYFVMKDGKVFPSADSSSKSQESFGAELANMIFSHLNALVKNQFKLIRGPRESPERPAPVSRHTTIDPETRSKLIALAVSTNREEEDVWTQLDEDFQSFSGRELRVRGSALEIRRSNLSLPVEATGSGDQALLILLRQFIDAPPVVGVEEPETRLHHDYQRRLFEHLKRQSDAHQVFVATHSPVFVDRALLKDTWLFTTSGKESIVRRLGIEDLKFLLLELGIQPSDIFLANAILLVEGKTEKTAIPLLAEKLGLDLTDVSVVPIHGKGKGKYHLSVWLEAAQNTNLGVYLMLDGDAEAEFRQVLGEKLIDRDHVLILKKRELREGASPTFEDFLPKDAYRQAMSEAFKSVERAAPGEPPREVAELSEEEPIKAALETTFGEYAPKPTIAYRAIEIAGREELAKSADDLVRFLKRINNDRRP